MNRYDISPNPARLSQTNKCDVYILLLLLGQQRRLKPCYSAYEIVRQQKRTVLAESRGLSFLRFITLQTCHSEMRYSDFRDTKWARYYFTSLYESLSVTFIS